MHIYIYICIHVCIHIYTCIYIHMYTYIYACVCIWMYIHVYIHIYTSMYVYVYTYVHIYTYTYTDIYIYAYTNMHIYTSSHTCTRVRTCVCVGADATVYVSWGVVTWSCPLLPATLCLPPCTARYQGDATPNGNRNGNQNCKRKSSGVISTETL